MKRISKKEFKRNIGKYVKLAESEKIIIELKEKRAFFIVPVNLNEGKHIYHTQNKEITELADSKVIVKSIISILKN